jgi:hypothetical protein
MPSCHMRNSTIYAHSLKPTVCCALAHDDCGEWGSLNKSAYLGYILWLLVNLLLLYFAKGQPSDGNAA